MVGNRERANQYRRRHAIAHSSRGIDAINASACGEPQLSVRGLDCGRQRSQRRSTADDAVESAERLAAHAISRVNATVLKLGRRDVNNAGPAVEPQVAVGRLDDARNAVQRQLWHRLDAIEALPFQPRQPELPAEPMIDPARIIRHHIADL